MVYCWLQEPTPKSGSALCRPDLERLVALDPEPMHLATHSATLEDVFMNLTGRRLRDG